MTRFLLPLFLILAMSVAAAASTDIIGPIGHSMGFSGRFPLVGGIGASSGPPPGGCNGVIDTSVGCPIPMLGM